jgi:hypothetical protein
MMFSCFSSRSILLAGVTIAGCQRRMKTPQKCRLKIPQVG